MKSIQKLFQESSGKVIYKWHHYLPIYESLFKKFSGKKIKVLEIGVLRGGSLKLWKEYFGADAQIYGIDIDPAAKQYEAEGIKIFIGDQGNKNFMLRVAEEVGGFDIVIDDGAHTNFMVMTSWEALYPSTRYLYIVEDTHALYWWWGFYSFFKDIKYAASGKKSVMEAFVRVLKVLMRAVTRNLSFMNFVMRKQNALTTEWHGFIGKSGLGKNQNKLKVSPFVSMTAGIRVYDSLVVFEKEEQSPRVVEFR